MLFNQQHEELKEGDEEAKSLADYDGGWGFEPNMRNGDPGPKKFTCSIAHGGQTHKTKICVLENDKLQWEESYLSIVTHTAEPVILQLVKHHNGWGSEPEIKATLKMQVCELMKGLGVN